MILLSYHIEKEQHLNFNYFRRLNEVNVAIYEFPNFLSKGKLEFINSNKSGISFEFSGHFENH